MVKQDFKYNMTMGKPKSLNKNRITQPYDFNIQLNPILQDPYDMGHIMWPYEMGTPWWGMDQNGNIFLN